MEWSQMASTRDWQWRHILNTTKKEWLNNGQKINESALIQKAQEKIKHHRLGEPFFRFQHIQSKEIARAETYNQWFENLALDMKCLNDIEIDKKEALERAWEKQEIQKNHLMYEIEKIHKWIKQLQQTREEKGLLSKVKYHTMNFNHFSQLDRQQTNAFIDLKRRLAMLPIQDSYSRCIDLEEAYYEFDVKDITEFQPFQNALSFYENEYWLAEVYSSTPTAQKIKVTITLPYPQRANWLTIHVGYQQGLSVSAHIVTENDETKWLGVKENKNILDWQFDDVIKKITLEFEQKEYVQALEQKYVYAFFISFIGLYYYEYAKNATVSFLPTPVDADVYSKITLKAKHEVPAQTSIDYYIGIENKDNEIDWQSIKTNESINLFQWKPAVAQLNKDYAGYGDLVKEDIGVKAYSIGRPSVTPIPSKSRLYAGDYMWKMKRWRVGTLSDDYDLSLRTITEMGEGEEFYLGIEHTCEGKFVELEKDYLYQFVAYVYCEKDVDILNNNFQTKQATVHVYVNQKKIKGIEIPTPSGKSYRYQYHLKKGWNEVLILFYSKIADRFQPNLYFKDVARMIVAEKAPMRYLHPYDFYYYINKHRSEYYTIEGKNIVIPYRAIDKDWLKEDVRFLLIYDFLPDDKKEMKSLHIMAKIERNSDYIMMTPTIEEIEMFLE